MDGNYDIFPEVTIKCAATRSWHIGKNGSHRKWNLGTFRRAPILPVARFSPSGSPIIEGNGFVSYNGISAAFSPVFNYFELATSSKLDMRETWCTVAVPRSRTYADQLFWLSSPEPGGVVMPRNYVNEIAYQYALNELRHRVDDISSFKFKDSILDIDEFRYHWRDSRTSYLTSEPPHGLLPQQWKEVANQFGSDYLDFAPILSDYETRTPHTLGKMFLGELEVLAQNAELTTPLDSFGFQWPLEVPHQDGTLWYRLTCKCGYRIRDISHAELSRFLDQWIDAGGGNEITIQSVLKALAYE